MALLAVYYLGLWFPIVPGTIMGGIAGAAYYFGLEKTLEKARKPAIGKSAVSLETAEAARNRRSEDSGIGGG